jgi:hypothetical protein
MMLFLVAHSKAIRYITVAYRQSVLMRVFIRRFLQICSPHVRQFSVEMANSLTVSGRMSSTILRDEQGRCRRCGAGNTGGGRAARTRIRICERSDTAGKLRSNGHGAIVCCRYAISGSFASGGAVFVADAPRGAGVVKGATGSKRARPGYDEHVAAMHPLRGSRAEVDEDAMSSEGPQQKRTARAGCLRDVLRAVLLRGGLGRQCTLQAVASQVGCDLVKMLNGHVLLFWIVTLLEVDERLSGPADTSLINFRVLKIM